MGSIKIILVSVDIGMEMRRIILEAISELFPWRKEENVMYPIVKCLARSINQSVLNEFLLIRFMEFQVSLIVGFLGIPVSIKSS